MNLEDKEDDKHITDNIRDFLCEDCQIFLGKEWSDGVIYHKTACGNDVCGEFVSLLSAVKYTDINISVEEDDWIMMCLPRYESLFNRAYQNEQELIDEMKQLYSKFLNNDFPFEKRLVCLQAVAWG